MSASVHVVVADPDPQVREQIVGIVGAVAMESDVEVTVHEASTGTTALALCTDRSPRLVISEVLLEGVSGLALLRRLTANGHHETAFILVTNLARENDRFWGLRNGALAYLAKPFDEATLRERIARVLTEGSAARADPPSPL